MVDVRRRDDGPASDNTAEKKSGLRPFTPGQSGNPAGRPKGSRNKATLAIEALLEGEAEAIGREAIDMALAGDTVALRLCLERIVPPRKDRFVTFAIPRLESAADAARAAAAIVAAVADGNLTPGEAAELGKLLSRFPLDGTRIGTHLTMVPHP